MDYRRVEKSYRSSALFWQVTLVIFLLAFFAYELLEIFYFSDNPPVELSAEEWDGAGEWALCADANQPFYGRGYSLIDGEVSGAEAGKEWPWRMEQNVDLISPHNCSIIDLTEWKWTETTVLNLCIQIPGRAHYYIRSNGKWQSIGWTHEAGQTIRYSYRKSKHGWNYGYASEIRELHDLTEEERQPNWGWHYCHHWTTFAESTLPEYSLQVTIKTPVVQVSRKLGALPQLFNLISKLGGWIAMLTFLFTMIFVKKHPESAVAKIYEARTFIGERVGLPMSHQSAKEDKATDSLEEAPVPLPMPPGLFKHLDTE